MNLQKLTRHRASATAMLVVAAFPVGLLSACGSSSTAPAASSSTSYTATDVAKEVALYSAMRQLWAQHMEWTIATVDAFFHNPASLHASLDRLLQNQQDIGAAIAPYYGQAAAKQLAALLTIHIEDAVPVLTAAKDGNNAALTKALNAWYANAKQIASFLSSANPNSWPTSATEPMMKTHITQTVAYSVDLLKGNYTQAVKDFDAAEAHMAMMSDTLSAGIIAQFPTKF